MYALHGVGVQARAGAGVGAKDWAKNGAGARIGSHAWTKIRAKNKT